MWARVSPRVFEASSIWAVKAELFTAFAASGLRQFFGAASCCQHPRVANVAKQFSTLPDLGVSSLRRGHANLLCVVPILTDDPRRESVKPRIPSGRLVRPAAAETRYKERGSKPTGFDGCVRVFPRLMPLVNDGNKKRILKPAARAGGRTVLNLSCTACHSYGVPAVRERTTDSTHLPLRFCPGENHGQNLTRRFCHGENRGQNLTLRFSPERVADRTSP